MFGMFVIFGSLLILDNVSIDKSEKTQKELKVPETTATNVSELIMDTLMPGLDWLSRWLPLFYVPSLVVLPLVVKNIQPAMLLKMMLIIVVGLLSSLLVTAQTAFSIRKLVKTEMLPLKPSKPVEPFTLGVKVGTALIGTL